MVVSRRNTKTPRAAGPTTLWRETLRGVEFCWFTCGEVVWVARPPSEWLQMGLQRHLWPRGGVYVYKRVLEAESRETVHEALYNALHDVTLTPATLSDLVNDLQHVDTQQQDNVLRFLTRWGLLEVGVPLPRFSATLRLPVSREPQKLGDNWWYSRRHGSWAADSVERTHWVLHQLKALFLAPSYAERWRLVQAIAKEVGRAEAFLSLRVDFNPSWGPGLHECVTAPLTGLFLAALGSSPFRACPECGTLFPVGSQDKQFCSTVCRVRHHRRSQAKTIKRGRKR